MTPSIHPSFVSIHQPILFGTTGYWSKIAMSDVHVVMSAAPYRVEDKLTSARLPSGGTLHLALSGAARIDETTVCETTVKVVKTLKQEFGKRTMPYRGRLEPILTAFEQSTPGELYLALWGRVASTIMEECRIVTRLEALSKFGDGCDTQARLEQAVQPFLTPKGVLVLGPGSRSYMTRPDRRATVVHQMLDPRRTPFLLDLVTVDRVYEALAAYALEAL